LIFLAPFFNGYAASRLEKWTLPDINVSDIEINNLKFTNRARCALDSQKPTESAFVLIQNMKVAKGLYRLAKATGNNSSNLTRMGIQVYRYAVINLLKKIHRKLMRGELPLLPVDTTGKFVPRGYASINSICRSDEYCTELDKYLENIWNISRSGDGLDRKLSLYSSFDNFDSKYNYISNTVFKYKNKYDLTCNYLKKFSPLQAQIFGVKPNAKVFEQMARANINRGEFLADCSDLDAQKDIKVAAYQIEIPALVEKKWKKYGFDYWNSLKLYFSWAWRNAPEMEKMAAPFSDILRGVAIEESVLIVPSGCKSIIPAKCDGDYLQLNVLREFAKKQYQKEAIGTDILSPMPEGPQEDLLEDEFPEVNTDILDIAQFETTEKWLENFRDNLSKTRGVMKRKLINSINLLNLVTANLKIETILEGINASFEKIGLQEDGEIKAHGLNKEEEKDLKDELFYLCSEFIQAAHDDFSFIKGDLEILKQTILIDKLAHQISNEKTNAFYSYYETLAKSINEKCGSLKQKKIWDDDFTLDKTGFSKWYIEKVYEGKVESTAKKKLVKYLDSSAPLLSYGVFKQDTREENVICINGGHCARKTLASIINLYAVAQYANTFWSMDQMIKTPSFFNPYAERTQCRVYDPWFKTKQIIFNLFTNLGQAAMSAFIPGAGVFASLELKPGKVISFNQLVKDGKIHYNIKRKRASIFHGLMADFGPLLGVPCRISISRHFENPYDYISFAGITVGGCYNRDNATLNVSSASDIGDPNGHRMNACASCTLNFETVASSLTAISNFVPYVGTGLFLFEGLVRLYNGLQDPHNIPRKWKSNPNYVLDTYRRFGKIPKKCVRKLRKGKQCLKNKKEEKIISLLRKKLKRVSITQIEGRKVGPRASVWVNGCLKPIKVKLRSFGNGNIMLPDECKYLSKSYVMPVTAVELPGARAYKEIVNRESKERLAWERRESEAADRDVPSIIKLSQNDCYVYKNGNVFTADISKLPVPNRIGNGITYRTETINLGAELRPLFETRFGEGQMVSLKKCKGYNKYL